MATRDDLREVIRTRVRTLEARLRVAEALRALAVDIVGNEEELPPAERAWLRQAVSEPVSEATDEALAVLVGELTSALRTAPARLRPALITTRLRRTDFE